MVCRHYQDGEEGKSACCLTQTQASLVRKDWGAPEVINPEVINPEVGHGRLTVNEGCLCASSLI